MNIEFKWGISNVQHYTAPSDKAGIISNVVWSCVGTDTDSDHIESGGGLANLTAPTSSIMPFQSVTEDIVLGWLFDANTVDKDGVENYITERLVDAQVWSNPWTKTADVVLDQ